MLDSPVFGDVTSADYYISKIYKQPTLYANYSCIYTTLQLFDMKEQEVEEISDKLCQLSTGIFLIQSEISYKVYCRQLCQHIRYFSNGLVPETKKENISDILYYILNYSGLSLLHILIHKRLTNIRHFRLAHPVSPKHNIY